jgi:hypothetical protein
MSKWRLNNHIIGKVYDLTQENMTAMIADLERQDVEIRRLRATVLDFQKRYQNALKLIESDECYCEGDGGANGLDPFIECKRCEILGEME